MNVEFAEQYGIPCLVLTGNENPERVIEFAHESEATYFDGEDDLICVRLPNRPQELYTVAALKRSLPMAKGNEK